MPWAGGVKTTGEEVVVMDGKQEEEEQCTTAADRPPKADRLCSSAGDFDVDRLSKCQRIANPSIPPGEADAHAIGTLRHVASAPRLLLYGRHTSRRHWKMLSGSSIAEVSSKRRPCVSPRLSLSTQESGNGDGHNQAMPQRSRRR
ncbi:uncharacterized protein TrAFT101_010308 [Trichoderma asperellum]|uniref:uncharacterized protein n=1 Tax=Trichoderma asperellum TaxID=101201 RepID=UPI003321AA94|nr:hypothetical protein TrAFT101_010308 [Trichoderma asperellum]